MSYPVTLEMDYVERRSRLTTFFRFLLVIPHLIVSLFVGIGLLAVMIIAWFALLFTGRWPESLYEFSVGALRFVTRVNAYFYLGTDVYPPFGLAEEPTYPVRVRADPPLEGYNRLKVLFRIIYIIPAYVIAYLLSLVLSLVGIASWLTIVVIGRQPRGLQNIIEFCLSYVTRAYALMYLLSETYPSISAEPGRA